MGKLAINLAAVFLVAIPLAQGADKEPVVYDCDSTEGWAASSEENGPKLSASDGKIHLDYKRIQLVYLIHKPCDLQGMKKLSITLQSKKEASIAIEVFDRDGARFQTAQKLFANRPARLTLTPRNFKLALDSPVKKSRFDPSKLKTGMRIVDLGPALGGSGENRISIDRIEVSK